MIYIVKCIDEYVAVYQSGLGVERFREWCKYNQMTLISRCEESDIEIEPEIEIDVVDDNEIIRKLNRHREVEEHNAPIWARIKELNDALPPPKHIGPEYHGLMHIVDPEYRELTEASWQNQLKQLECDGYIPAGIHAGMGYIFKHVTYDDILESQREEREALKEQLWKE